MKKSILFLLCVLTGLILFNGCRKADKTDVTSSEDLAVSEDFDEQNDIDIDVAIEERGGGDCPTVTMTAPYGSWPNTITIDFGDGCTRPDGRVLKGKLIVAQTAELRTPGAVRTITHDDFFVDDVQVEGTRTWTYDGQVANLHHSWTKTASDMKLSFPDGSVTTWNKTRSSVLIEGAATPLLFLDDVWSSTGEIEGVNRNGVAFSASITTPLIKKAVCRWIAEGVITFTRGDKTSTLDFGDGSCDRKATFTNADGDTFTINLRR